MQKIILFLLGIPLCLNLAFAQQKTLSPYFLVTSQTSEVEQFPLLSTTAKVDIAGVIANVHITQCYQNTGSVPMEAQYIFPASTNAAVYGMEMTIGDRKITAKIAEKNAARQQYAAAKQAGKTASLLEQERPNVFQMKVANILPDDEVEVHLFYTELLAPTVGIYEFVYPTVVGPRYAGETPTKLLAANKWVENPYLPKGETIPYTFDMTVNLNAGMPISGIASPSHAVNVNYRNSDQVLVDLKGKKGENKDFILRYQLKGKKISDGLLLHEGKDENHFLLMLQPPKRPQLKYIPKREYIFIVDVSGSMNGFPIETSKTLLKKLIGNLRPTDKFNVLLFAGSAGFLAEQSLVATPQNIQKAMQIIDYQQGSGGTDLLHALQKAMTYPATEGTARSFVIATDGYINVENEAYDLIRNNLHRANFFAFGIGSSVNRFLIEGIARVGQGRPFVVTNETEAKIEGQRFKNYIEQPVLTDIRWSAKGVELYDLPNRNLPDLFAERPLVLFGKYKKDGAAIITLTGKTGGKGYKKTITFTDEKVANNPAIPQLWAREQLKNLSDYAPIFHHNDQSIENQIIQLGLQYNLLTKHTSFVAVDERIRNKTGNAAAVKQPLPLPEGVENSAIGNANNIPAFGEELEIEPPRTAEPPPPFPPVIEEVPEEEIEFIDQSIENNTSYEYSMPQWNGTGVPPPPPPPPPSPEVEEIFKVVERMPRFPACEGQGLTEAALKQCADKAMMAFIYKHLKWPPLARGNCIEGTVVIQFTVEKDGRIVGTKVIRDIGAGLGAEALRVVNLLPNFIPGQQRGRPVRVQFNLPVKFRME